jgi:hypothetical protein
MISTQVGFIAQLKGTLTKKRYTAATIFVDHCSRLKYIHLMTTLTSEETIEAKQAFKHFAKQHSVRILHYHCNNGKFADNAFKNSCSSKGRRLIFCGVNARFQKWHLGKGHQGPPRECTKAAPPCASTLACRHPLGPLAIHT